MLNPAWKYLCYLLALMCLVLGLAAFTYRGLYKVATARLGVQNQQIKDQTAAATRKLTQLTEENKALVDERKAIEKHQKEVDDDAIKAIHDADTRARSIPVRVRCETGPRSGGSTTASAPAASPGAADPGPPAGVLGPAAAEQFNSAVREIEVLQAAFNSCKGTW